MAVGFSPGALLAELATRVAWPWPFLSAPQRFPYTGCGFAEDACTTSTAGAIRRHLCAARRGVAIRAPVEDTRQLGADAVVVTSQAV